MKISELIEKLYEIMSKNGDIPCISVGFDGGGYDDIRKVEARKIYIKSDGIHQCKYDDDENGDNAVYVG